MRKVSVNADIRWRWWFRFYLVAVMLGMAVTGRSPNWQRVEWWIRRGLLTRSRH